MFATTGQIAVPASARGTAPSLFATFLLWAERSRQRRTLASLTVEALKDIGIDPAAATQEAAKPFWVG
jgi:uncharacterized protein YjiS (DUF1127 family)